MVRRALTATATTVEPLAFYCVCDRNHFLGLVTLINSLRLVGHCEPIYVLDCGLEPAQRRLLEAEAVLEAAPRDLHPMLLKNVLPLRRPAEVMIVVDVDVIFTRRIYSLAAQARREGKPILFLNDRTDRFHSEWETLGFGPPVPHEHINSGHYVLPSQTARWFLDLFEEAMQRVDPAKTLSNPDIRPQDPFYYGDQDVLNALIGTAIPSERFAIAERDLVSYWPFRGLRVEDERTLDCALPGGHRPVLLHHIMQKPWSAPVASTPYTQLMTRLLCSSDVAIRVPRACIPWRLRSGAMPALVRCAVSTRAWFRARVRGRTRITARLPHRGG